MKLIPPLQGLDLWWVHRCTAGLHPALLISPFQGSGFVNNAEIAGEAKENKYSANSLLILECLLKIKSEAPKERHRAPEMVHNQSGASPLQAYVLRLVVNCNCVIVR